MGSADVGIVFGNQVLTSGEPSARLTSGLDKAVELYSASYFEKIIISGGLGKEGFDEALVMKESLMSQGIPETIILVDTDGMNTFISIENSFKIMEDNDYSSALVI